LQQHLKIIWSLLLCSLFLRARRLLSRTAFCRAVALGAAAAVFIPEYAAAEGPALGLALESYFAQVRQENSGELKLAVEVRTLADGKEIFQQNSTSGMTPASVQKLLITALSLRLLGGNYRFPTEVFLDHLPRDLGDPAVRQVDFAQPAADVGNLYIRGYGDPTMDSDRIGEIADTLRRSGVQSIHDVILDDSLFMDPPRASGGWAHEAGLSAVAVNYNCYAIYIAPGRLGQEAAVSLTQGAPYELLSRVMTNRGRSPADVVIVQKPESGSLPAGAENPGRIFDAERSKVRVTVQGGIGHAAAGQTVLHAAPDIPAYFAGIFSSQLKRAGIAVSGHFMRGETPAAAKLLQTFESKELAAILQDQNQMSNNIIAGQLLYAIGQDSGGYFRADLGLSRLSNFLERLGEKTEDFALFDASGLDHRNRLTTAQIVKVLLSSVQDFSIAPDFLSSLSRYGRNGTLKTRTVLDPVYENTLHGEELERVRRRASSVWAKTGTLDKISSLAGVLETASEEKIVFAIMSAGLNDKEQASKIEDNFVKVLLGFPLHFAPAKIVPPPVPPAAQQTPAAAESPSAPLPLQPGE
jgi:D-alanyl-D-alanine carboxypeptidase/D-alanyl-D-alanine-endopeptidase (penicillin-binding protein 4)